MSTDISRMRFIQDALDAYRRMSNENVALLKCKSYYPDPVEEANLKKYQI